METITRETLKNWIERDNSTEHDINDDLYNYFEHTFGKWEWTDIADEGRDLWNMMFDDEIEKFSPKDGIFAAVAASSAEGVLLAMSRMLGISRTGLAHVVSVWTENQDNPPESISFAEFEKKVKDEEAAWQKYLASLRAATPSADPSTVHPSKGETGSSDPLLRE